MNPVPSFLRVCLRPAAASLCAATVAILLVSPVRAQTTPPVPSPLLIAPPTLDANNDGINDIVTRNPGWNPTSPVFGRVVIRSEAVTGPIRLWLGPEPDDHFGYAACAIPDVDGDNKPDIAVGAPTATNLTDPPSGPAGLDPGTPAASAWGRVYIFSSATGNRLLTIAAAPNALFGIGVSPTIDMDGDFKPDLAVRSATIIPGLPPPAPGEFTPAYPTWRVHSSATGALLASGDEASLVDAYNLARLTFSWNSVASTGGGTYRVAADLNASDDVEISDLTLQLGNFGEQGTGIPGDLNAGGSVDSEDLLELISALASEDPPPVPADPAESTLLASCCKLREGTGWGVACTPYGDFFGRTCGIQPVPEPVFIPPEGDCNGGNRSGDHDCDGIPDADDCDSPLFQGNPAACGDDDGDGTKNQDDCDSTLFAGDRCADCDDDGDGIPNHSDCDSSCSSSTPPPPLCVGFVTWRIVLQGP